MRYIVVENYSIYLALVSPYELVRYNMATLCEHKNSWPNPSRKLTNYLSTMQGNLVRKFPGSSFIPEEEKYTLKIKF